MKSEAHLLEIIECFLKNRFPALALFHVILFSISITVAAQINQRPDSVIADFENENYGQWRTEGNAFGANPVHGTLPNQNPVSGFVGKGYASSYHGGDRSIGKLISPEFTIERDYINFLIGGGDHAGKTCANLYVDGKLVYSMAADGDGESLSSATWNVKAYIGKQACIELVDNYTGGWGHILADDFVQSDIFRAAFTENVERGFTITDNMLMLPVSNAAKTRSLSLEINGAIVRNFRIQLANEKVDYWAILDTTEWNGKKAILRANKLSQTSKGMDLVYQTSKLPEAWGKEKYRPKLHFTPRYGWMNDPNGMVYYAGEYHLFYQHYPYKNRWNDMHWGHAVSRDLLHWEHLPVALFPDEKGMIFSGCAVVDEHNTTGFQTGVEKVLVAIFTLHHANGEDQGIAYSNDKGRTWTMYEKNPVLKGGGQKDFRDPKIIWFEAERRWIMVLAVHDRVQIYSSGNLKEWKYESDFGAKIGGHRGVWECPDLIRLPVDGKLEKAKWLMIVSVAGGSPQGANGVQYFIGDFDGKRFRADDDQTRWLDYGTDNYASASWSGIKDRCIITGWMNSFAYSNDIPTMEWNGTFTLPRELFLETVDGDITLISRPIKEITSLYGRCLATAADGGGSKYDMDLSTLTNGSYEVELTIGNASKGDFAVTFGNVGGDELIVGHDKVKNAYFVDRSKAVYAAGSKFAGRYERSLKNDSVPDTLQLRIIVDQSAVEVFFDDGKTVFSELIYPQNNFDSVRIAIEKGMNLRKSVIRELRSVWR